MTRDLPQIVINIGVRKTEFLLNNIDDALLLLDYYVKFYQAIQVDANSYCNEVKKVQITCQNFFTNFASLPITEQSYCSDLTSALEKIA